jgi:hypothetical protein
MRPGALLYTPPACLHSYRQTTPHRNTGITPRGVGRPGHLHLEETGEVLEPTMAPFWFLHAENHPARPAILPAEAFLRSAYCGRFRPGQEVWQGSHDGWWALLVREGEVDGEVGTAGFALVQGQLLVASAGETAALRAASDCECAFALGWPQG